MIKKRKRWLAGILCFALFMTIMMIQDPKVKAEVTDIRKKMVYLAPKGNKDSREWGTYIIGADSVSNPKSSNPEIATVSIKRVKDAYVLNVLLKKTGIVTISYEVNNYIEKVVYNVKKYTRPVTSLKIGSDVLTSKFKNSYHIKGKKLSGKINAKGKNGWKLAEAWKFKISSLTTTGAHPIFFNLKKKIKVVKGDRLCLEFQKGNNTMTLIYDVK